MNFPFIFGSVNDAVNWLSIGAAILVALVFLNDFKKAVPRVLHFGVIALILVLGIAAYYSVIGFDLGVNWGMLRPNLILVAKDTFLGGAGLMLCEKIGLQPIAKSWDESLVPLRLFPKKLLAGTLLGFVVYSITVFRIFGYFPHVNGYLNEILIGSAAAVVEELYFRLFLIGILLFIFRNFKSRLYIAITLSALYWAFGHLGEDLIWAKFFQVFPVGLLLGWIMKKYGLESAMLLHIVLNFIMVTLFVIVFNHA